MQASRLVAVLLLVLVAELSFAQAQEWVRVKRVVDGDTIVLQTGERVRLIGVDTPETKRPNTPVEYFGREATEFTRRMVEGKPGGGVIRHLLKRLQLAERLKQHSG